MSRTHRQFKPPKLKLRQPQPSHHLLQTPPCQPEQRPEPVLWKPLG